MCYFLEIAIPKAHVAIIESISTREILAEQGCVMKLSDQIPTDFIAFSLQSGGCACDLYTGPRSKSRDIDKEKEKYRKKGWSESKIERAIKDRQREQQPSFRADAKEILDALVQQVKKAYILVHWSDDEVKGTKTLATSAFVGNDFPVSENEIVSVS